MPHVLIAGCGYVGSAAAKLFRDSGWEVTGWTRSIVDITDRDAVLRNRFAAQLVIHCASTRGGDADYYKRLYYEGARNVISAFPEAKIIFTSSTSVYPQTDGSWVNEETPAAPSAPTGKILRAAEDLVLANSGLVLRLGAIYGPGRSFLLDSVLEQRSMPATDRYVNQVHRDDAAAAIQFLAGRAASRPRIFNIVDDAAAPRSEIAIWLSQQLQIPLTDPASKGRASAHPFGSSSRKRGHSNKRVSNAKLRALGWAPIYPSYIEGFIHSVLPALRGRSAA